MIYTILGIVSVVIAISILIGIILFLWEHKVFTFIAAIITAGIIYYKNAEMPFEFIEIWWDNTIEFLWKITYRQTIFDSIWIYCLLLLLVWGMTQIILKSFKREMFKNVLCTVVSFAAIALACSVERTWVQVVLIVEILINISMLWLFKINSVKKIGCVRDVVKTYIKVEAPNLQLGVIGIVVNTNLLNVLNDIFDTAMPLYLPGLLVCAFYIVIQVKWYVYTFKGYRYIVNYTKEHGFLRFGDYCEAKELSYLSNVKEYASSITEKLVMKEMIYLLPFGNKYYINKLLKKNLEKNIKANLSSREIEKNIKVDFGDVGFEKIYKTVFAWIKGYQIDFKESAETKIGRKNGTGVMATEFVLMRYPIEKHPILIESDKVKSDYILAMNGLIHSDSVDTEKWNAKVEEYKQIFEVDSVLDNADEAINSFSHIVKRKVSRFKAVKTDYSYLLLLETMYFRNLLTEDDISYREIEETFDRLKIKKKYRDFIYKYIKSMYIEGNIQEAEQVLKSMANANIRKVLEYVHQNIMWNERYVALEQYNVAVCATMSAGKSTFINAMLGSDYIPSKNEACTAKITTIRDNDNLNKIIGCYTRTDETKVYSNLINADVLSQWNDDIMVQETVLEGNLEEIDCENGILVMHDTPGTNNSGDDSHHDKTIEFLKQNKLNMLIYLINAEYISTKDTEILLKEIQEIERERDTKIVFGLNKVDCFDEEGNESLAQAIENLCIQLKSYGFENPIVFPFSANAARLFKLVLKGKELTRREQRDFANLLDTFSVFNASDYVIGATCKVTNKSYIKLQEDKKVIIRDKEYSYNGIVDALNNTGILIIEKWISESMKNSIFVS